MRNHDRSSDEAHRCIVGPSIFFGRSLHRHPVHLCADIERGSDGPLLPRPSELLIPLELEIHPPLFTLPPFRNVPGQIILPACSAWTESHGLHAMDHGLRAMMDHGLHASVVIPVTCMPDKAVTPDIFMRDV